MGLGERLGGGPGAVTDPVKRSFPPVVDSATRVLVLGSLPGERSLAEQRYYAHPQNQFWRLMSPIAGTDLVALGYEARLETLRAAGIGLWDVVAQARRTGSSDAAIRDLATNDLAALVPTLPQLRAIGFNGATALRHGTAQLGALAGAYAIVPLPSSSPLHTIGAAAKQQAWLALADHL
jgi:hypoxanthine-DNA glycosylase